MNCGDRENSWRELLDLYGRLQEAARSGEWGFIAENEARRYRLLEALFSEAPTQVDEPYLRALQRLNNEIQQLAEQGRADALGGLQGLRKSHHAVIAYRDIGEQPGNRIL